MRTDAFTINGKPYLLTSTIDEGTMQLGVNGMALSKVFYNQQYNIYYAPYQCEDGDFWVIVYKNTPRIRRAVGELTEEAFIKNYARRAFSPWFTALYLLLVIGLPVAVVTLLKPSGSSSLYFFSLGVGMWVFLIDKLPIFTVKFRRLSLIFPAIVMAIMSVMAIFI
jgi:hypothetical protein